MPATARQRTQATGIASLYAILRKHLAPELEIVLYL